MKNLIIKVIIGSFLFFGATLNAQESIISKDKLPQTAQKIIEHNFSNSAIDYIIMDKETFSTDYEVKFTSGVEVEFDSEGKWMEVDGNKTNIPTGFIQK